MALYVLSCTSIQRHWVLLLATATVFDIELVLVDLIRWYSLHLHAEAEDCAVRGPLRLHFDFTFILGDNCLADGQAKTDTISVEGLVVTGVLELAEALKEFLNVLFHHLEGF